MTTTPILFSASGSAFDPDADSGFTASIQAATQSAHELAEVLAADVGPYPGHAGSSDTCAGCAVRCETPESHNWGCPCAPHGPGAARQVAEYLASNDFHAHLVVDGHDMCVSGDCEVAEPTLAGTLL